MIRPCLCSFVLATFLTSAASQSTYLYSPAHTAKVEGRRYAYHPGYWSAARYQFLDGDQRGKVGVLREIAFRLDDRSYSSYTGQGRTWSSVHVQLADGDVNKFGRNFSANLLSTPTTAFQASVSWPTLTGKPITKPALWGGVTGAYRIPFKSVHLYIGQRDLISDFTFAGGKLANNAAWWTGTRGSAYYIDGWYFSSSQVHYSSYQSVPQTRLYNGGPGVTGLCTDSAYRTIRGGAYLYTNAAAYGPWYTRVGWRKKLVMYSYSYYTAPGSTVIHAWGVTPNLTGINIGTGCYKLHAQGIVLQQAFRIAPRSMNSNGFSGYSPYLVFPWDKQMSGFKLITQAAWVDSVTGRLNLSQARQTTLPSVDFNQKAPVRMCAYQYGTYGPYTTSSWYFNPCLRYVR